MMSTSFRSKTPLKIKSKIDAKRVQLVDTGAHDSSTMYTFEDL